MGVLFIIWFRALPCAVALWLGLCLFYRLRGLARTPVPLRVGLEPLAQGRLARLRRFGSILFGVAASRQRHPFLSLGAVCLHLGLILALLGHLRLFLNPVPGWLYYLVPLARAGGLLMTLGLAVLAARRLADPRLWHVSKRADYGVLGLLMGIGLSGLAMVYWNPPDPSAVKAVTLGFLRPWSPAGAWPGWLFSAHMGMVMALAAIFPFSKLMHGPNIFLNPVYWQVPVSRLTPHLNPWESDYVGDAPSREAVLPGEPQPWTLSAYRNLLRDHWADSGTKTVHSASERGLPDSESGAK
jgi:nitrate reductase gamma subunit